MAGPPEVVGPPPLGIPPKGVPPTDPIAYRDLIGKGKLRPLKYLDVREFGAAGDGSHDDAPAIQRAIAAALKAGGGLVYLPKGTYRTSTTLDVSTVGLITIRGEGPDTVIKSSTATGAVIDIIPNQCSIEALTIDGVDKGRHGIRFNRAYPATSALEMVDSVDIINCDSGISGGQVILSKFSRIRIDGCNRGLSLLNRWINVEFSMLEINHITNEGIFIGTAGQECEGLTFSQVNVFNAGESLKMEDGLFIRFSDCIWDLAGSRSAILGGRAVGFSQCWISTTGGTQGVDSGLLITPSVANTKWITFTDCCLFANAKYFGLHVSYDSTSGRRPEDIRLTNCIFYGNGYASDGGDIRVDNVDRLACVNCSFLSNESSLGNVLLSNSPTNVHLIECFFMRGSIAIQGSTTSTGFLVQHSTGYITTNTGAPTGSGAQQTIAHGLSKTPTRVYLCNGGGIANAYQSAAADATNIYITAVNGQSYIWRAEVFGE